MTVLFFNFLVAVAVTLAVSAVIALIVGVIVGWVIVAAHADLVRGFQHAKDKYVPITKAWAGNRRHEALKRSRKRVPAKKRSAISLDQ